MKEEWRKFGLCNAQIDGNVLIGYQPERKTDNYNLIIGDNARIRSGTVIYLGSTIGNFFQTGHNAIIREENRIGNNVAVYANSVVDYGCKIGDNVKIHTGCYIAQYTTIEDDVFLAPGVMIANDLHPGCDYSYECLKGPVIRKGTKVGVNVTLLPHITIGENCLIGSGSVVVSDIPANSLVVGNPARVIKSVFEIKCTKGFTDYPYKGGK